MPILTKYTKILLLKRLCVIQPARTRFKNTQNGELSKLRCKNLSELLDCAVGTARMLIKRNAKILSLDDEHFTKSAIFCKNYLKLSDVIEFPVVVSVPPSVLSYRYTVLRELGCENIRVSNILHFNQLMKETPQKLQNRGIIQQSEYNLAKLVDQLKCPEDMKSEIASQIQQMYLEKNNVSSIKSKINAEFLSWRLNCPMEKIEKVLQKYSSLQVESTANLEKLIEILVEKYGFSISRINQNFSLLTLESKNLESILETTPSILGISIKFIAKKAPMVLKKSSSAIKQIENIFEDFDVTSKQLLCCMKILCFLPATIHSRLVRLCESEDFAVLKNSRSFLWLVYHFNSLTYRLKLIKESDTPCSLSMFIIADSNFKKHLCVSKGKTYAKDICCYLSGLYNCSEKDLRQNLQQYPNIYTSSILNAHQVTEFLNSQGITKEQLWYGLGIILYDIEVVKEYFNILPNYKEFQPFSEWVEHFNLVQLLIYAIEKDINFMGRPCEEKFESEIEVQDDVLNCEINCNYVSENESEERLLDNNDDIFDDGINCEFENENCSTDEKMEDNCWTHKFNYYVPEMQTESVMHMHDP